MARSALAQPALTDMSAQGQCRQALSSALSGTIMLRPGAPPHSQARPWPTTASHSLRPKAPQDVRLPGPRPRGATRSQHPRGPSAPPSQHCAFLQQDCNSPSRVRLVAVRRHPSGVRALLPRRWRLTLASLLVTLASNWPAQITVRRHMPPQLHHSWLGERTRMTPAMDPPRHTPGSIVNCNNTRSPSDPVTSQFCP